MTEQQPPFLGLTGQDIAALSRNAVTRAFPKNTITLSEGDKTDSLSMSMARAMA